MRLSHKLLIVSTLSFSIAAMAALPSLPNSRVLRNGGIAEILVQQLFAALGSQATARITLFGTTFGAQQQAKFEMLMSALAISVKQEAVSAQVQSEGIMRAAQGMVAGANAVSQSNALVKAHTSFAPSTGQGHDVCGTLARTQTLDRAFNTIPHRTQRRIGELDNSPGRMVTSRADAMNDRLRKRRDKFCTEAEAGKGLCQVSQLPGGDTNAALLFESAPANSLQAEARKAYMQHVLGAPDQLLPASTASTPEGQHYAFLKNRKDAFLSVPAYSLAMIDVANTQVPENDNRSPNDLLKMRVNQYFGGESARNWAASLTSQEVRGLLVEQAKMGGLDVWLRWQQLEQASRIEANLATMVLLNAERTGGALSEQHRRVLADALGGSLK